MQPQDNSNSEPASDPPKPEYPQPSFSPNSEIGADTQPAGFNQPSEVPPPPVPSPSNSSSSLFGSKKKRLLIGGIAAAVILLFGGGAAAYFGIIVPSKPENVWKKSLENTGKGYDKLVEYAETKKDIKGGKLNGSFKLEAGKTVADGTMNVKYDQKTTDSKITLGASGTRFELDLLTNVPEGAKYPDVYAKVTGLKGIDQVLGDQAGGIGASLASFENQWFVVDHTIFDQAEKSASSDPVAEIKSEDVVALAKDIGNVTKEYVLTDDPSKAVLVVKENVGKETMDGRSVYHYKVSINKANLKAYNKALCDKVLNNEVYKTLSMGQSAEDLKTECYDTKDLDSINESDTFDVWVDLKTKLIHIVRIAEKDKKDNYFDFGLLYTGGDEYPFVLRGQSKDDKGSGKGELKVTLNTKTDKFVIDANIDGIENNETFKFTMKATAEPSNDKVEFKKPEGAKSLLEAYGALLGGVGGVPGAGTPVPDQDLINRCISSTAASLPPECEALFNEQ